MIIAGLRKTDNPQSLKTEVLSIEKFEGAQNSLSVDRFGDVTRGVYFGVVKNGTFAKPE